MLKFYKIALGVLIFASTALADDKLYGAAGCGLGSLIVGKGGSQVIAGITNMTSYSQFFGITSGTSNCVDQGVVKQAKAIPLFVEANLAALERDSSRGQGVTIVGLARLLDCRSSTDLGSQMQKNYSRLFSGPYADPNQVTQEIRKLVDESSILRRDCSI